MQNTSEVASVVSADLRAGLGFMPASKAELETRYAAQQAEIAAQQEVNAEQQAEIASPNKAIALLNATIFVVSHRALKHSCRINAALPCLCYECSNFQESCSYQSRLWKIMSCRDWARRALQAAQGWMGRAPQETVAPQVCSKGTAISCIKIISLEFQSHQP
jgi:hypothetical protein